DAANLGRNLASNQATSAGLAINAGNSSASNAQMPIQGTAAGANIMQQGYAGAQSGLAASANTYGQIANIQNQAADAGIWGALGQVGGAAITAWSDETMKEDVEPVNPDAALAAVEATPVSNWAYKNGTAGDDGGQTHTGPMAQDVNKTMGEKAAPKGKKVDLVSMNGVAMAAIQGLSQKVDRLAAAAGLPA
ncbi:MAG: tail fiber domain-containing protein, partial [Burkholderiales bacterium]